MKKVIVLFVVFLLSFTNIKNVFAKNNEYTNIYNINSSLVEQHMRKDLGWSQEKLDYMIKNNPKDIERIGNEYLNIQNMNNKNLPTNIFEEMFQKDKGKYYQAVFIAKEKCEMTNDYILEKIENLKIKHNFYNKSQIEQQKISEDISNDFAKNVPYSLKTFMFCNNKILPLEGSTIDNEKDNVSKLIFILGRLFGNINSDEKEYLSKITD